MKTTTNTPNPIKGKEFLEEYCNTLQKTGKVNKSKKKKGRPRKPEIKQIFDSSIRHIETLFYFSQAKQKPIITQEFFLWIQDHTKGIEKLLTALLWYLGVRIGELVNIPLSNLKGNKVTVQTSKKRNKEVHHRTTILPSHVIDILHEVHTKELIQKDYLFRLDKLGTTKKLDDLLRDLSKRLYLNDIIEQHTNKQNRKLTAHMFRRGRATQLFKSKVLNKDQVASFLGQKDNRSLPHYLPQENESFLDYISEHDKGMSNPIIGTLREDRLNRILDQAFKRNIKKIQQVIQT